MFFSLQNNVVKRGKKRMFLKKEPLVNKFISVPKDKGSLNCASFMAGIIGKTRVHKSLVRVYDGNRFFALPLSLLDRLPPS
jgi:hypothetical protein